ncbi:hypothetical protein [Paractinoplanes durhamensis]|uniref:Lipoprotein n=1 Tax=Paractinoplanes durhamensis TaxID=113563 RepID=A0ABQ3YWT4_9ACTN|nr:hypothetical protein [Actinoplanes durhamensis]GIE02055.1 hypothetical protein Adu01nite_34050 [Actinoplanes durhamensis]
MRNRANPTTRVRRLTAVLAVLTCVAACTRTEPSPEPTPDGGLLRLSDLPAGFTQTTAMPVETSVSEPKSCGPAMDHLEMLPATDSGVAEQRVNFTDALGVSRVQEIVRTYGGDASQQVTAARTMIAACPQYLLTYATGGQIQVTMTITRSTADGFTATITAGAAAFTVYENLTVARIADKMIVLSHTGPTPPDAGLTGSIAAKARSRAGAQEAAEQSHPRT